MSRNKKDKIKHLSLRYEHSHSGKYFAEEALNRPKIDLTNLDEHKKNIQREIEKLEKMSAAVQLAMQQIGTVKFLNNITQKFLLYFDEELYTHEISKAQTKINEANARFTKDVYVKMTKLKKFPLEFETIINSFMLTLGIKEKGREAFKGLNSNFNSVKTKMNSLSSENLRQDIVDQLLPLWKNYIFISQQLFKCSKGAQYLLDWMTGLLELKIKSETLKDAQKKYPELQKKVRDKIDLIAETNSLVKSLEERKTKQQSTQTNNSQIFSSPMTNPTRPFTLASPFNLLQTGKSAPFYSPKSLNKKSSSGSPMDLSYAAIPKQLLTSPDLIPKAFRSNESSSSLEKNFKQFSHPKIPNKLFSTIKIEEKYLPVEEDSFFEKNNGMETQRKHEKKFGKVKVNKNKISEELDINFHDVSNMNDFEINSSDIHILSYDQAKKPLPRNSNSVDYQSVCQNTITPWRKQSLSKTSMIIMNNLKNASSHYIETAFGDGQNSEPQKQYNVESEYVNLKNEFKNDMKVRYKNASFQMDSKPTGFREIPEIELNVETRNEAAGCYRKSIRKYFCV